MTMQLRRSMVGVAFAGLCAASLCAPSVVAHAQDAGYLDAKREQGDGYVPAPSDAQRRAPEGYLDAADAPAGGYFGQPKSTSDTTDTFVAAPENAREHINGGLLMLIAYAGFWLLAIGYVTTLAGRARHANRELVDLRRHIEDLDDRIEEMEARRA